VEDVWNNSHEGAPAGGTAWTDRERKGVPLPHMSSASPRGGAWGRNAATVRSANRGRNLPHLPAPQQKVQWIDPDFCFCPMMCLSASFADKLASAWFA
jgi:hypothetical protein